MKYMFELISTDKVKAHNFHTTKQFIDGTLNDWRVFNDVYKYIYPLELQLNVEHAGSHTTFLNLDVIAKGG